eukprot:6188264-Pleurochrysis_carterae.AAC.1
MAPEVCLNGLAVTYTFISTMPVHAQHSRDSESGSAAKRELQQHRRRKGGDGGGLCVRALTKQRAKVATKAAAMRVDWALREATLDRVLRLRVRVGKNAVAHDDDDDDDDDDDSDDGDDDNEKRKAA